MLPISVTLEVKSATGDDCHLEIAPTSPLNVKTVVFVLVHTSGLPVIVPPTEVGETVMITESEASDKQLFNAKTL